MLEQIVTLGSAKRLGNASKAHGYRVICIRRYAADAEEAHQNQQDERQ